MGLKYNFSDEQISDMINMYYAFEPIYKIANKYNVDFSVIKKRLSGVGVKLATGSPYSINHWVERGMTKEEASVHVKTIKPTFIEYWVKLGYSKSEAILQIEGQKLVSLRGCIARYGNIEGTKIWNERTKKRSEWGKMGNTNIKYWLTKGYSESEAKKIISERQSTFTLNKCIEKYGEIEGKKRFTERQIKWSNSLSSGGNLKIGYSKISQKLFYELLDLYNINERNNIFFATHNKEFRLEKEGGGVWLYDFTDTKNKKIIEYNGDDYHANPKKYIAEDHPNPFRKELAAKEIWDKDKRKFNIANEEGFEVMVIWDSEYRWGNKQEIINKCKEFLNIL